MEGELTCQREYAYSNSWERTSGIHRLRLDFDGLSVMLGRTLRGRRPQRLQLGARACTEAADPLLVLNAREVNAQNYSDFYYDPHTKHYTGPLKTPKGWCGSNHFADKVLHTDFIHTCAGHPVYIAYADNYEDLRKRFGKTVENFRNLLNLEPPRVLTFVPEFALLFIH
jgi:hypothetical protein